jgi:hypothetical protein
MMVIALIGAQALWLTYLWLASAIVAAWIAERKGYSERVGLAAGLLLSAVGVVLLLALRPRPDSRWRRDGALPRRR